MKPVASGATCDSESIFHEDVQQLMDASTVEAPMADICPYFLTDPVAPTIAAKREGRVISLDHIALAYHRLSRLADICIVESAGGVLVPLAEDNHTNMLSIAKVLHLPIILVVGIRLGAINHALLTYRAICQENIRLAGWAANRLEADAMGDQDQIIQFLSEQIKAPMLADMAYAPEQQKSSITSFPKPVSWMLPDDFLGAIA